MPKKVSAPRIRYLQFLEEIKKNINELNIREQKVLEERLGLNNRIPKTYEEIGKEFCVTRERIRQIEVKALKKIGITSLCGGNYTIKSELEEALK